MRREPGLLKEFLDSAGELREAYEALLAGGEREPLEAASSREREAAGALVDAAQEAAGGGGPGLRDHVASTLRAPRLPTTKPGPSWRPDGWCASARPWGSVHSGRRPRRRPPNARVSPSANAPRGGLDEAREHEQRAQRRARDAGQSMAAAKERAEAAMEALERAQREEEQARAAAEAAAEVKGLERRLK